MLIGLDDVFAKLREILTGCAHAVSNFILMQNRPTSGNPSYHIDIMGVTFFKINRFLCGLKIADGDSWWVP